MEQRSRITRNLPVKIVCPNTRHRIINQVIYEEFIRARWYRRRGWAKAARERLLEYDIDITEGVLQTYKNQIKSGERDPVAAPSFSGGLFEDSNTSRYGKDGMYKQFELWRHIYGTADGNYVGLPANQILSVIKSFGAEKVFACERNKTMAKFMQDLQRHFCKPPRANIINDNIFAFLERTSHKFSTFDFDLMCQISSSGLIDNIAYCIANTMTSYAIANIATTIGRWISEEEYQSLMPGELIDRLKGYGIIVVDSYSSGYNDRIIPMRYELLALELEG